MHLVQLLRLLTVVYAAGAIHALTNHDFLSLPDTDSTYITDEFSRQILSSAHTSYDEGKNGSVVTPQIIVSSCQAFIDAYADVAAEFTRCSVLFARPLRFCQNCVRQYVTANAYSSVILKNVGVVDLEGNSCWEAISSSDRVQIIIQTVQFIDKLWGDCDCQNCFAEDQYVNGTVQFQLNNDTIEFFHKANETWECFSNASLPHVLLGDADVDDVEGNTSTCVRCEEKYRDLSDLYTELDHKYHMHVCMDIVDLINSTRSAWSNVYHCNQGPDNLTPVFVLSGFLCMMPIIFYVGSKVHGSNVQNKLVRQRRLKDTAESGNSDAAATGQQSTSAAST